MGTCGQLPAPTARGCVPREHHSVNWLRQASLAVCVRKLLEKAVTVMVSMVDVDVKVVEDAGWDNGIMKQARL